MDIEKTSESVNSENTINTKQKRSVFYLIQLINECQNRGAFSLDEASSLFSSIKHFTKENQNTSTQNDQKNSIILFINSINKAQKKGLLELEEAYKAWDAIQSFTGNEAEQKEEDTKQIKQI